MNTHIRIIFLPALLLTVTSAVAQTDATSSAVAAPQSIFIDPLDGAFDAGQFILSAKGFLPMPILITEPAVGYGGGLAVAFLRYPDGKTPAEQAADAKAAGQPMPRVELPSISLLVGGGTENGTWFGGAVHIEVFNEGAGRSQTILFRPHAELTYYGAAGEGPAIDYSNDLWIFRQQIEHRVKGSDWFLGGHYTYLGSDSVFDFGSYPPASVPPVDQFKSTTAGVGANISYDSRDTPFTPNTGIRAQLILSRYAESLGGDYDYTRIDLFSAKWWTLNSRMVLGWRLEGHFTPGDDEIPFYHQPSITQRGIPAARYQGRQTLVNELELRYSLNTRWSLIGFAGAGQVTMDDPGEVIEADLVPAVGTGFRYLLARQLGMHAGCDFAWSEDDFAFYLTIGSAWQR